MQHINLFSDAKENKKFRRVIFTGKHSQLSIMSLKPGESVEWGIGNVDKIILVVAGQGVAEIAGEERPVREGDLIFITAGTRHNLVNSSEDDDLKLAMIYAPSVYPSDTSHSTKAKALQDPYSDHNG